MRDIQLLYQMFVSDLHHSESRQNHEEQHIQSLIQRQPKEKTDSKEDCPEVYFPKYFPPSVSLKRGLIQKIPTVKMYTTWMRTTYPNIVLIQRQKMELQLSVDLSSIYLLSSLSLNPLSKPSLTLASPSKRENRMIFIVLTSC